MAGDKPPSGSWDVSQEGIGLLLPSGLVDDPVERQMVGELAAHVGMILIIGLGAEPQRLWIPGEVMNCSPAREGRVRAGVQFATPASQENVQHVAPGEPEPPSPGEPR